MENQDLALKGTLILNKFNKDGILVESRRKDNIIVNGGFDYICNSIGLASPPSAMGYVAIGTSSTAAVATQTSLVSELIRGEAVYSHTAGTKVMSFTTTFEAGVGTGAITEAGVFNASSAGVMLDRVVFSVINKGVDDTLTSTFQFTLS